MRRFPILLISVMLAWLGTAFAIDGNEELTVLEGLRAAPDQFSTFLSLLDSAGLTAELEGAGPVTVLAPSNAAFEAMDQTDLADIQADPDRLSEVLNGLILPGEYTLLQIKDAEPGSLVPLSGVPYVVEVTADGLKINGVGFAATDVDNVFSNGVVQVAELVILPNETAAMAATPSH